MRRRKIIWAQLPPPPTLGVGARLYTDLEAVTAHRQGSCSDVIFPVAVIFTFEKFPLDSKSSTNPARSSQRRVLPRPWYVSQVSELYQAKRTQLIGSTGNVFLVKTIQTVYDLSPVASWPALDIIFVPDF